MVEFNPDGSIKLPGAMGRQKEERENLMRRGRCISITKEVVSDRSPKQCALHIKLSDGFMNNGFIERIYGFFKNQSEVPSDIEKVNHKEYKIKIGTSFRRCTECNSLICRLRESFNGRIIEDKGSCSFKERNFCYEDYFD